LFPVDWEADVHGRVENVGVGRPILPDVALDIGGRGEKNAVSVDGQGRVCAHPGQIWQRIKPVQEISALSDIVNAPGEEYIEYAMLRLIVDKKTGVSIYEAIVLP
jgi:hypothetical protein